MGTVTIVECDNGRNEMGTVIVECDNERNKMGTVTRNGIGTVTCGRIDWRK